jgi:hypothetical protein
MRHVISRPKFNRDVLLAFFSDTHGGIHDDAACRTAVEVCEAAGVDGVYLVGDGLDCGVSSRHEEKQKKAKIDFGTAIRERDSFGWFFDWMMTRQEKKYVLGNHEAWLAKAIELDPRYCHMSFAEVMRIPSGIEVLPQYSRIRIGSLVMEHGDAIFPKSNGGKNPAARLLDLFPDHSTIIGHLHHADSAFRTYYGEDDVPKFRRAEVNGHLSLMEEHLDYAGRQPGPNGWQQRFLLIRIWHYAGKPHFTIRPIDIFRDAKNRPLAEFEGKVFQ